MKILLSAYACEPNKGSEPSVGWNWAIEVARLGHETWVITRANNKESIELSEIPDNLHFIYYDLPKRARWWKSGRRGVHLYYLLWQWGAYQIAKKIHEKEKFELVHHVTFVGVRQPSFMGNLEIPFIFGPVAGGESAPWRLRNGFGFFGQVKDATRDVLNQLVRIDPMMKQTFKKATKIYVTSEQTKALVSAKYQIKTQIQLAIGVESKDLAGSCKVEAIKKHKILYVGNFLYLKGMHIGIEAFSKLSEKAPNVRLTMVGKGPDEMRWKNLAKQLGVSEKIDWVPWLTQAELNEEYLSHDIFLFPSLHDSGGMVVLEAMSLGLPVVCLDLGGPGVIVNETCGKKIVTKNQSYQKIASVMANELNNLIENHDEYSVLSNGAVKRSQQFKWAGVVNKIYGDLKL